MAPTQLLCNCNTLVTKRAEQPKAKAKKEHEEEAEEREKRNSANYNAQIAFN